MSNLRLIARLDVKGEHLIKGVHFEGLRKIGQPEVFSKHYYQQGADELLLMDAVASLYGRNHLSKLIEIVGNNVFIPITVGGGIRSVEDVSELLNSGADKIAINTAAVENPKLISKIASKFGSQCVVLSIEAKKVNESYGWEVYTNGGRERTGLGVLEWVRRAEEMGAGEILITSIDKDGTQKGFDVPLISSVNEIVNIPVIASGGMGCVQDASSLLKSVAVSGFATGSAIHYQKTTFLEIRSHLKGLGIEVRKFNGP